MYDIDLRSIADNKIKGVMSEIGGIHDGNLVKSMSYDRMMRNIYRIQGRLNVHVNESVLSLNNRTLKTTLFLIQGNKLRISHII